MAASCMYAVGLLLMPVRAEAMAPWDSTNMSNKTIADKNTQAQKASELEALQAASDTADSFLSGNMTILHIMQGQQDSAERDNFEMAREIEEVTAKLLQAQKDLAQKGKVLNESIKMVNQTAASLRQASAALSEAQKSKVQKNSANYTASEELAEAEDNLQKKAICCAAEVPAARENVTLKQKDLANASAALAEAESVLAAKKKALKLAEASKTKAVNVSAAAEKAYQDAVGMVNRTRTWLEELRAENANPQNMIASIRAAVEKQKGVLKTLDNTSRELHNEVDAKKREYDEISAVVKKDVKCISRLQAGEATLAMATRRASLATDAYTSATPGAIQDALRPALWQLKDQEEVATNALYKVQKDCAPPNVTLPEEPPLPNCSDDSGGYCGYFSCHPSRNAKCCDRAHTGQLFCPDTPSYKCTCPPGTCARGGACQDRGSPVLLASPSTELRAEPAAAGTVLLAAAALTVTTLLVMRMCRTPEIRIPEYWLG